MLFASEGFCGQSVIYLILILWGIIHLVSKAAENPEVREGVKEGFWAWFYSDDD